MACAGCARRKKALLAAARAAKEKLSGLIHPIRAKRMAEREKILEKRRKGAENGP